VLQPRADMHVDAVGEVLRPRTEGRRSGEEHASLVAGEDRKRQSFSGEGRRDLADGVATLQLGSGSRGAVVLRVAAACDRRKQAKREYASGEARESDRIAHGTKRRPPRSHQPHSLEGALATVWDEAIFASPGRSASELPRRTSLLQPRRCLGRGGSRCLRSTSSGWRCPRLRPPRARRPRRRS
jgi:hypothetical protein